MHPLFVSFGTTSYEQELNALIEDFERFGLDWKAELITDGRFSSWREACGHKPMFILEHVVRARKPVVWLDADARLIADPSEYFSKLRDEAIDFAAYFIPNSLMRKADIPGDDQHNDGIASGTMFFNFSKASLAFLSMWVMLNRDQMDRPYEQQVLGNVWYETWPKYWPLRTHRLPQGFCKVFDQPWRDAETHPEVVRHMQASRKLKRKKGQ